MSHTHIETIISLQVGIKPETWWKITNLWKRKATGHYATNLLCLPDPPIKTIGPKTVPKRTVVTQLSLKPYT